MNGTPLPLDAAGCAALLATASGSGGAVTYGIRPEDLTLAADGALRGMLAMVEPTGPETYAKVDTPLGALTARLPGAVQLRVGEPVGLAWPERAVHLFDEASGKRLA